jgi:hypothetical protein
MVVVNYQNTVWSVWQRLANGAAPMLGRADEVIE